MLQTRRCLAFVLRKAQTVLALAISGGHQLDQCGLPPNPLNDSTPNVLVVGDLISGPKAGYLSHLQRLLKADLASVQYATAGDFTSTSSGVLCIDRWIGGLAWDVIVIALGLGDCVQDATAAEDTFAWNLEKILSTAGASAQTVLYVTATPFDRSRVVNESFDCVVKNNQASVAVVEKQRGAYVADLFYYIEEYCRPAYSRCSIQ